MAEVDTNLYTAAFGQNESITPMQMATAVAAIANGGYLVTPYVVDSISDKDGNIISQTETNIRRQVISEEVSRQLLAMMENNVHGAGTTTPAPTPTWRATASAASPVRQSARTAICAATATITK